MPGDKNSRPRQFVRKINIPGHAEFFCNRTELFRNIFLREPEAIQRPFDTHEKCVGLFVNVLVGVNDVPIVGKNKIGNRCSYPLLVRTGNEKNGMRHLAFPNFSNNRF